MILEGKKILITPLNWGIGHAARCAPLIKALRKKGAELIIGSDGKSMQFLQKEFPEETILEMPANEIRYGKKGVAAALLPQLPAFFKQINADQKWVNKKIQSEAIDLILSDNRYGCYHKDIPSILITHQLNIQAPKLAKPMIDKVLKSWVNNFNEIWVPDEQNGLAGELTKANLNIPVRHLGVLSRVPTENNFSAAEKIDLLILLSGPEPQRSILEEKIWKQLAAINKKVVFVRGTNDASKSENGKIKTFDLLGGEQLTPWIQKASRIVCRSGYSTLMDLAQNGKCALLIPTPGQTEQEYLGRYFTEKKWAIIQNQNALDLTAFLNITSPPAIPFFPMNLQKWMYQISVLLS